jgi:D-amino-acid dehydrogenase
MRSDVIVLGAGIVGVATALNLQQRGRSVVLVDKGDPGRGTSYGNAGMIQREAVTPYAFPQDFSTILSYALNNRRDAHYHLSALPKLAPALFRYWRNGRPEAVARTVAANIPLFEHCLSEHAALAEAAGVSAALRKDGWIKVFRTAATQDAALATFEEAKRYGVESITLDKAALAEKEPHLRDGLIGGLHFEAPYTLANPLALTVAYEALFEARGGTFLRGDARSLNRGSDGRWSVTTASGAVDATDAVLAMGPWSDEIYRPLGYQIPLFVKRGYHLHFGSQGNAVLNRPVLDADGGFMLVPMSQGVRLTTGVEFALRDAPPTPVQMTRSEPWARTLYPLGEAREKQPWMGCRPCLPDMLPVIGPAPRHKGLWFTFGHAHHGLTLAGSTGRLIAEMITGEAPYTDPTPYRADRF